jgi:hypothetical protein
LLETRDRAPRQTARCANPGTTDLHSTEQESSRAFMFFALPSLSACSPCDKRLFVFLQNPLDEDGFSVQNAS